MIRLTITTIISVLISLCSSAQDPKAQAILKKVNTASEKTTALQYDYEYEGWGKVNGKFKGSVMISKDPKLQIRVELNTLDEVGKTIREEIIYVNGDSIKLLDKGNRLLKFGTSSGGSGYLSSYIWYTIFRESLIPNPFQKGIDNPSLTYEGTIELNKIRCHVIGLDNPWGDRNYWYFGINDNQIHGQRQESLNKEVPGGFDFKMSNVKYDQPISPQEFIAQAPEQFSEINEDKRIIAVGEKAPEWSLKNGAGENVSNRDFKGKVIVLDFWASWCNPCWKIMPIIAQIKSDYSSKNVEVFGVNVWENPKLDVQDYLQKKKLNHYDVLFDTEADVAKSFKISYLPLVVVIDTNGKIAYLSNGAEEKLDEKIRQAIDYALKK